nr:MAG TPA: Vacuolar sorting protein 39 domain 2 [Caudoviricetes sp.]
MNNICNVCGKRLSYRPTYRKPYWFRTRSKTSSHRGCKRTYFKPRYKHTDKTFS